MAGAWLAQIDTPKYTEDINKPLHRAKNALIVIMNMRESNECKHIFFNRFMRFRIFL